MISEKCSGGTGECPPMVYISDAISNNKTWVSDLKNFFFFRRQSVVGCDVIHNTSGKKKFTSAKMLAPVGQFSRAFLPIA